MSASTLATAALWSYGFAAVAFAAFALRLAIGWRGGLRASLLLAAIVVTGLWAGSGIAVGRSPAPLPWLVANVLDALRYATWFAFVGSLLRGSSAPQRGAAAAVDASFGSRWMGALVAVALLATVVLADGFPARPAALAVPRSVEYAVRLGLAVFGLILVEQLLRRAPPHVRWSVKPLCLGLAGVFAFDLALYADAMLFGQIDTDIWVARGIGNALIIPFVAISTARNTGWTIELHMSRGVVFHSTALLLSGAFLLAAAGAGYFVRYFGGEWGRALSIELLFAALLLATLVVSSGRFRSKLSVFVSKHFFSYRYDYREEWLRFTRTLSAERSLAGLQVQTIKALADLVESPAGTLWLRQEGEDFRAAARWNMAALDAVEPANGPLATFLERTGWIVDLDECRDDPSRYPDLAPPDWLAGVPNAWLVVPLASGDELLGFAILATPRTTIDVNWEVRDLLKTASRQAASYLGQIRATEALLEARKFDAFNRMSAFVVHDLKNLVAQLALMLRNSERHHANPEFQRDMLATVEHVVGRMNQLMLQLRTGTAPVEKPRSVDLDAVVRRVCAAKPGRRGPIEPEIGAGVVALGHEERLEHVIGHLLQNALDATASGGTVGVRVRAEGRNAIVEVSDTGPGMSEEFVRDRLFKPFETTKAAGMGIGVYESQQYVQALGGQINVDSAPGRGTRVAVVLPATEAAAASPESLKVA